RYVGGGAMADQDCIKLFALRQLPDAHPVIASRQILAHKELFEPGECRHNLLLNRLACGLLQALLVCRADLFWKARKWLIKPALRGIADELLVKLSRDPLHDDLRMAHMLAHPLAHQ